MIVENITKFYNDYKSQIPLPVPITKQAIMIMQQNSKFDIKWDVLQSCMNSFTETSRVFKSFGRSVFEECRDFGNNFATAYACTVQAASFLPKEEKEAVCKSIEKISLTKSSKLTLGDLFNLFGIAISVLFNILSLLPNDQLNEISEQSSIMIERQAECIQLQKKTIDNLTNIIELLSDEINLLRDELQSISDTGELESQSEEKDP